MEWNEETVKRLIKEGKNPRLYEPIGIKGLKKYEPGTPEEKANHEEFLRKTEEYLRKLREEKK